MKGLLLSLLTLFVCVAGSYASIRCYVCTGAIEPISLNPWCNDKFDNTTSGAQASIQTCNGPCVKLYTRIAGIEGYVRQCSNDTTMDCLDDCASLGDIYTCQHCCKGDLCNSATSVTFNLMAAVAMLVSACVFKS